MPGFIPFSRASLMLDVVAVAMIVVIPTMAWSIYLVKYKQKYALHKKIQLGLGIGLLIAVLLFEVDMRLNGWRQYAEPSPYYGNWLTPVLWIHLVVAVSTTILWIYTIIAAVRRFVKPVQPNEYSPTHRRVAKAAAMGMLFTAVTGWVFYWMAFVAEGSASKDVANEPPLTQNSAKLSSPQSAP